jgi:hypothetical protein
MSQVQVDFKDNNFVHFKISIEGSEVLKSIRKELNKIQKTANLPGFRKGAVPMQVIEMRYGKEVAKEHIGNSFNEAIRKSIEDEPKFKMATLLDFLDADDDQVDFAKLYPKLPEMLVIGVKAGITALEGLTEFSTEGLSHAKVELTDDDVNSALIKYLSENPVSRDEANEVTADTISLTATLYDENKEELNSLEITEDVATFQGCTLDTYYQISENDWSSILLKEGNPNAEKTVWFSFSKIINNKFATEVNEEVLTLFEADSEETLRGLFKTSLEDSLNFESTNLLNNTWVETVLAKYRVSASDDLIKTYFDEKYLTNSEERENLNKQLTFDTLISVFERLGADIKVTKKEIVGQRLVELFGNVDPSMFDMLYKYVEKELDKDQQEFERYYKFVLFNKSLKRILEGLSFDTQYVSKEEFESLMEKFNTRKEVAENA